MFRSVVFAKTLDSHDSLSISTTIQFLFGRYNNLQWISWTPDKSYQAFQAKQKSGATKSITNPLSYLWGNFYQSQKQHALHLRRGCWKKIRNVSLRLYSSNRSFYFSNYRKFHKGTILSDLLMVEQGVKKVELVGSNVFASLDSAFHLWYQCKILISKTKIRKI